MMPIANLYWRKDPAPDLRPALLLDSGCRDLRFHLVRPGYQPDCLFGFPLGFYMAAQGAWSYFC